jgi:hypothetical protein
MRHISALSPCTVDPGKILNFLTISGRSAGPGDVPEIQYLRNISLPFPDPGDFKSTGSGNVETKHAKNLPKWEKNGKQLTDAS